MYSKDKDFFLSLIKVCIVINNKCVRVFFSFFSQLIISGNVVSVPRGYTMDRRKLKMSRSENFPTRVLRTQWASNFLQLKLCCWLFAFSRLPTPFFCGREVFHLALIWKDENGNRNIQKPDAASAICSLAIILSLTAISCHSKQTQATKSFER